jgi:hypothetical protein
VEIVRPSSPRGFLELAAPLLARDAPTEARHNLILGIAGMADAHPDLYPTFHAWIAVRDGAPVAAASRTPPFNLVLSNPISDRALGPLLDAVRTDDPDVPGLVGNVPHVHTAAERWARIAGVQAELVLRQGVYALTSVREVSPAPGCARAATSGDRALLLRWFLDFATEVPGQTRDPDAMGRALDSRLADGEDAGLWLWEHEGEPVSLAGFTGPTPSGIRVGPVYTPVEHRRRVLSS